ncbi:MAG: hypothetical protein Q7R49_03930 [Candidatus Daviesbacteria bacterium]|nr:hypothetical protein [Candidatus Daviesbacteria bacterium]
MVDSLAEKPQNFPDFDNAFNYLTEKQGRFPIGDVESLDILAIPGSERTGILFTRIVIHHQAINGHYEHVIDGLDNPKPGLTIERFDPQLVTRSLSGEIYRVDLSERIHTDYYDPEYLYSQGIRELGDLPKYIEGRKEAGVQVAENIRKLLCF